MKTTTSPNIMHDRLASRMFKHSAAVLVLAAVLILAATPAAAQDACDSGLLERVQRDYQALNGFTTLFSQEDRQADGRVAIAEGTLAYFKPGRMRWEYAPPNEQLLVTDGETVWLVDPLLENVTVQPLRGLTRGTPLAFLLGAGKLTEDFRCRPHTKPPPEDGLTSLELVPAEPIPALDFLQIGVRPGQARLRALRFVDTQGSVRLLRLGDLQTAESFPESHFTYEITPEMEVIRRDG